MKDEILHAIATLRGDDKTKPNDILKIIRVAKGMNQVQLAELASVSRATISAVESGINKPSVELAKKLGDILKVDWSIFF